MPLPPPTHTCTHTLNKLQVANEGMPVHNFPSQKGTLHVKFIVDLPKTLSGEQKAALDKIL